MKSIAAIAGIMAATLATAQDQLQGRVKASGLPISGAQLVLWLAESDAPQKIPEVTTETDGSYELSFADETAADGVFYLISSGGAAPTDTGTIPNAATALMATLGTEMPERVTINDLTTNASVWTNSTPFQKANSFAIRPACHT